MCNKPAKAKQQILLGVLESIHQSVWDKVCVCVWSWNFRGGGAHTYTMQRVISVHCQVISWHHQSSRHLITGRQYMFCWWINRPDSFASVNCFEVRPLHCSVCMSVIYVLSTSSIVSHTQFHRYWAWFLVLRIMRVSVCVRGWGVQKNPAHSLLLALGASGAWDKLESHEEKCFSSSHWSAQLQPLSHTPSWQSRIFII